MVDPRHTLTALAGWLLLTGGIAASPAPADPALAAVGPTVLRESDFERFARAALPAGQAAAVRTRPEARRQAIDAWLDLAVQAAVARQRGIDRLPTFRKALELMEMKLLVRAMTDRIRPGLTTAADVSEAEIDRCRRAHPDRFQPPRQPPAEARGRIAAELARERNAAFHRQWLAGLRQELGFRQTPAARPEAPLPDDTAVAADATIAYIGATAVTEADFRWFLRDAFRAGQRQQAFAQPGARRRMLEDFLNLRLLEAKAVRLGIAGTTAHRDAMALAELRLLAEFLLERDGMNPWQVRGSPPAQRAAMAADYMRRLENEIGARRTLTGQAAPAAAPAVP